MPTSRFRRGKHSVKLINVLLLLVVIMVVSAATVFLWYEWTVTLTTGTPEVRFIKWSDQTQYNTIDITHTVFPSATSIETNCSYGIKNNNSTHSKTVYLWVESCNDTSKIANFTIKILNATGETLVTWTTSDWSNLGENYAVNWILNANTIHTIYLLVDGSSSASGAIQVALRLKYQK